LETGSGSPRRAAERINAHLRCADGCLDFQGSLKNKQVDFTPAGEVNPGFDRC